MPGGFGSNRLIKKAIQDGGLFEKKLNKTEKKQVRTIVKRNINKHSEMKWYEIGSATLNQTTAWSVIDISGIQQGITDIARVGDFVTLTRLRLRLNVRWNLANAVATDRAARVRFIVFQWVPLDNPNPPTELDILNVSSVSNTVDTYSFPRHDNRDLYRILFDGTWTIAKTLQTAPTNGAQIQFNRTIKLKKCKKEIQFTNTTIDGSGKIYIAFVSDLAATGPDVIWDTRLNFRDA